MPNFWYNIRISLRFQYKHIIFSQQVYEISKQFYPFDNVLEDWLLSKCLWQCSGNAVFQLDLSRIVIYKGQECSWHNDQWFSGQIEVLWSSNFLVLIVFPAVCWLALLASDFQEQLLLFRILSVIFQTNDFYRII